MLTIKAKQIDDRKNNDMVMLSMPDGMILAMIHIDSFLKEDVEKDGMYIRLFDGEELTLSVAIAGDDG